MPAHVIVGTQWGDEGKGRVVDWFAAQSDIVARYGGGDNAGHSIHVGGEIFKLHLVPSGITYPDTICVMGNGMVVNPHTLARELRELAARGVDISPGRVLLSDAAHLILPTHIALDRAMEARRGGRAIGTTSRGIGPAYTDKAARAGLRAALLRHPGELARQARARIEQHNRVLEGAYEAQPVDAEQAIEALGEVAAFLAPYLSDTPLYLHQALAEGKTLLCEGAQATLLDLDHGDYPYVTSSSATVGGAITGLGIGPQHMARVTGVVKCFSTRVGAGPFPTELHDEMGDRLRGSGENPWDEFGTTTGRPRRCGWLDTVLVRYAARINGLTDIVITKLDVLSGIETLQVADAYRMDGTTLRELPRDLEILACCEPVYQPLPGWQEGISGARALADLPGAARQYVETVERLAGTPVSQVTVGPEREQVVETAHG